MKDTHHEIINQTEINHWWYRVRRKMVHDIIDENFPNRKDLNIMDLGCGTGVLMKELLQYGNVSGVDISPKAQAFCKERGLNNVIIGNITNLECENNKFDLVLMLDVLEHIEDDNKAIREIYRIVKPGGIVVIFVPAFMFLWGITDVQSEHYRRYTLRELRQKLLKQNFKIKKVSYFNTFLFLPIVIFRLGTKLLKINIKSENKLGNKFIDPIFYGIFYLESELLRICSFPFGVSGMIICQKKLL